MTAREVVFFPLKCELDCISLQILGCAPFLFISRCDPKPRRVCVRARENGPRCLAVSEELAKVPLGTWSTPRVHSPEGKVKEGSQGQQEAPNECSLKFTGSNEFHL